MVEREDGLIDYDVYVWTYANPYATLEHYDVTI